jgi:hypothetical protein
MTSFGEKRAMELIEFMFTPALWRVLLVGVLIAIVIWGRGRKPESGAAKIDGTDSMDDENMLAALQELVKRWLAEQRLTPEVAAQVQALIAQEQAARPASVAEPTARSAPGVPAVAPAPIASVPTTPVEPAKPRAPRPAWGEQIWAAVLSLRTRQTLLFLGAFLLVVSALILIVFNWASFPPLLQFALLASVCGAFWIGGAWMGRQQGLEQAAAGLRAVGGVLVPVVAFSLSRPGLLDLTPRGAWLFTSALSLPIYTLAAWRLCRPFYAVAACVSAASVVLASLSRIDDRWLPLALIVTLISYLPLAFWLGRRAPQLAAGPRRVAHAGVPIAIAISLGMQTLSTAGFGSLAATLWAGAAFYALAAWHDRWPIWI